MALLAPSKPTGASQPRGTVAASEASIELYWLPLGAGGWFVRLNGRIYEAIRPPAGGRAPGWEAGLVMARRHQPSDDRAGHTSRVTSRSAATAG
jgi:hypothetical protein